MLSINNEYKDITDLIWDYMKKEDISELVQKPFVAIRLKEDFLTIGDSVVNYPICIGETIEKVPIRRVIFRIGSEKKADDLAINSFVRSICSDKKVLVLKSVKVCVEQVHDPEMQFLTRFNWFYYFSTILGSIPSVSVINPEKQSILF